MNEVSKKTGLREYLSIYSRNTIVMPLGRLVTIVFLTRLTMVYQVLVLNTVIGIPSEVYGIMASVCTIVSIVFTPISGIIIEKVHMRWGQARSWCYVGGFFTTLFLWLLFTDIGLPNGTFKYIYYGFLVIIVPQIYNFQSNAGYILLSKACKTSKSRADSESVAIQMSAVFKILTGYVVVPFVTFLIATFGKSIGYSLYALVCALVMYAITIAMATVGKPFEPSESKEMRIAEKKAAVKVKKSNTSVLQMIRSFFSWPVLSSIVAMFGGDLAAMIMAIAMSYYYIYVVNDVVMMGLALGTSSIIGLVGALVAPICRKLLKNSSRNVFIFSDIMMAVVLIVAWIFGKNATMFTIFFYILFNFFYTISSAGSVPMYIDACDYQALKQKANVQAFLLSCLSISGKTSSTLGGAIIGFYLARISFDAANVTARATTGIINILSLIPAIICLVALVFIVFHPEKKYQAFLKENRDASAEAK